MYSKSSLEDDRFVPCVFSLPYNLHSAGMDFNLSDQKSRNPRTTKYMPFKQACNHSYVKLNLCWDFEVLTQLLWTFWSRVCDVLCCAFTIIHVPCSVNHIFTAIGDLTSQRHDKGCADFSFNVRKGTDCRLKHVSVFSRVTGLAILQQILLFSGVHDEENWLAGRLKSEKQWDTSLAKAPSLPWNLCFRMTFHTFAAQKKFQIFLSGTFSSSFSGFSIVMPL